MATSCPPGGDDQVTAAEVLPEAGAAVLHQADEQAAPLGEADGVPQLVGHVGGGEADAEAAGTGTSPAVQLAQTVPQGLVAGRAR